MAICVERLLLADVPVRRRVHVVMEQLRQLTVRIDGHVEVAVRSEDDSKHHGVGRAIGGAERQLQRRQIEMRELLTLLQLHETHVLGQRLQGSM